MKEQIKPLWSQVSGTLFTCAICVYTTLNFFKQIIYTIHACCYYLSRSCDCRNIWLLLSCSIVFVGRCFLLWPQSKHLHIRNVSSAAREATMAPSGLAASWIILPLCPVRSATLLIQGYFQMESWLCGIPWPDISSWFSSDQRTEHT